MSELTTTSTAASNNQENEVTEAEHHHLHGQMIPNSPYKLIANNIITTGGYSKITLVQDTNNGELFFSKLVPKSHVQSEKLKNEYELYRKLGPGPGLAKVHYFGHLSNYNVIVMDLLGPNLEKVFVSCNHRFSVRATTHIAVQILEIIRFIHSQKILFCNVKPENICLGRPNTPNANQIHLIGFTHAKIFETESRQHIPKTRVSTDKAKQSAGLFGTPRYMSVNAHKGKQLSRRDDLESIGYVLLYFLHGKLPWQGLQANNGHESYERIYTMKKRIRLEELCAGLPAEYYHYMLYVRTLKFAQEPNYRYLIEMFVRLLYRLNLEEDTTTASVPTGNQWTDNGNELTRSDTRKQVSFKMGHDSISIQSDSYFPYVRRFSVDPFNQDHNMMLMNNVDTFVWPHINAETELNKQPKC